MKPESKSRRIFGITRAKGKMFEFGLPLTSHIAVPADVVPEALFLLTVGTLGDAAAFVIEAERAEEALEPDILDELGFSASFFDAFLASGFSEKNSQDVMLLGASSYYLAKRPGSSLVLARRLGQLASESAVDNLLSWVLQAQWANFPEKNHPLFGNSLSNVARLLAFHFYDGSGSQVLPDELEKLRRKAYAGACARDLLFINIAVAVVRLRLAASSWNLLYKFTTIPIEQWASVIQRPGFPKEMWPSQVLIGQAGVFAGASAIIQMPTSAGKTRSVEIALRSAFMSGRARLAIVVAPFRALCHEVGTSLRHAFKSDKVMVNELSDVLQMDFLDQIAELFDSKTLSSQYILVLTPEKLLYVLRQSPELVKNIGIVVYDEGHQFDTGRRGVTYELLLTEIKALLPQTAQTILISAVIRNAEAIGQWLIGETGTIVDGSGLLPTARSVAFATWLERLGQLLFYESGRYTEYDYFVPRAIEQQKLDKFPREQKERYFPEKGNDAWKDVALYLGIRLAPQGAVAIFCGRKDTVTGLVERAIEVYDRGYNLESPATSAEPDEIRRLKNLIAGHFGETSSLYRAAELGIFVHHGSTPHGLRLAVEHAMRMERISCVICTSTLAQGVNLPIRYLIVSGIYQAGEKIKTRDFQNLMGRAGRAGMHTEGLVIFADPRLVDVKSERWKFDVSVKLLDKDMSEETGSSLLQILAPFKNKKNDTLLPVSNPSFGKILLGTQQEWEKWADDSTYRYPQFKKFSLLTSLRSRRSLLTAVESYLMANRTSTNFETYKIRVRQLATSTLAYHLASETEKTVLVGLLELVANHIQNLAPAPERQAVYAKTLLGVDAAVQVEAWVEQNRKQLLQLTSTEDWLEVVWPLFSKQLEKKFFGDFEPPYLQIELAKRWLQGESHWVLIEYANAQKGTKPWGTSQRRNLTEADVFDFCETTLGFDCSLLLAAVAQFLFGQRAIGIGGDDLDVLMQFQKALKYGLPDPLSISCFERGFADRVLAQKLRDTLFASGYTGKFAGPGLTERPDLVAAALIEFPTYFESVLEGVA